MNHKAIAFERGGGFAARCETCGAVTFGGFESKAAAKAALDHEEAE